MRGLYLWLFVTLIRGGFTAAAGSDVSSAAPRQAISLNGERNSLPLSAHWFLRGAPYLPDHAFTQKAPRGLLVDLQHFDLASDVIPDIGYLAEIDPLLMLWDTHDQPTVKIHGLIFETRAARGRLLVSAVRHSGKTNAAGRWLLRGLLERLRSPSPPRNGLSEERRACLKNSRWRSGPCPLIPAAIS